MSNTVIKNLRLVRGFSLSPLMKVVTSSVDSFNTNKDGVGQDDNTENQSEIVEMFIMGLSCWLHPLSTNKNNTLL